MRVTLDDRLFATQHRPNPLDLLRLLHFGLEDRHLLHLPPERPHFEAWAHPLPERLQHNLQRALQSAQRFARKTLPPLRGHIRIEPRSSSDWSATPPGLTLQDALALLNTPLRILVENRYSDGNLLRELLQGQHRAQLHLALERQWCTLENAGGLGGIPAWLNTDGQHPAARLRAWALFDHDGDSPGQPSPTSLRIGQRLDEHQIPWRRLRRRNAESYLSRQALGGWISHNPGQDNRRLDTYNDLKKRHTERAAWHHLNLKALLGDGITDLFLKPGFLNTDSLLDPDIDPQERADLASSLLGSL